MKKKFHIITAYAEPAAGPGWANAPLYVVKKNLETGKIQIDCIQPENQTLKMQTLYPISAICHGELVREVEKLESKRPALQR